MTAVDEATIILLQRLQTGWQPKRDEIDARIPQRTMPVWTFAVDLIQYPEDDEFPSGYGRAEKLLGRDAQGFGVSSGEILWIDAGLRWALCEDAFWWLS